VLKKQSQTAVKVHDLWPTRIWAFELSDVDEYVNGWLTSVKKLRAQEPTKPRYSMRGGWHSDRTLFADPVFRPLAVASRAAFHEVFKKMEPLAGFRFRLEAWSNIQDKGGVNVAHTHANCLLSACYYLEAAAGAGEIVFRDPRVGAVMTGFPGRGLNCPRDFKMRPKNGTLVIFPNWLEHYVEPHTGDFERVSIAMNAVASAK